jgi:hypothetical protein
VGLASHPLFETNLPAAAGTTETAFYAVTVAGHDI